MADDLEHQSARRRADIDVIPEPNLSSISKRGRSCRREICSVAGARGFHPVGDSVPIQILGNCSAPGWSRLCSECVQNVFN